VTKSPPSATYILTGVNGGIGSSIAVELLVQGANVIGLYNKSHEKISELYAELEKATKGRLKLIKCGSANEFYVDELKNAINTEIPGRIQGFIHCAANLPVPEKFENMEWGKVVDELNVQVGICWNVIGRLIKEDALDENFSAVGISTIYAHNIPPAFLSHYVMAKAGLNGLFRALSVEYGPRGFRFNLVSPGMTATAMLDSVPEKAKLLAKMSTPLRRLAETQDITSTVLFLLSKSARHITGQNIAVAGGGSI